MAVYTLAHNKTQQVQNSLNKNNSGKHGFKYASDVSLYGQAKSSMQKYPVNINQ
jgi:hypothetical protein